MKKLKFQINKKLDELMAHQFITMKGGGVDFGAGIIKIHPYLKQVLQENSEEKKEKIIKEYFEKYYKINSNQIKKRISFINKAWKKKEVMFYKISEKYFGRKFPKGMYVAYASILDCNPRFLESRTFQIYYKKTIGDAIHTIAHELLHFIFYDFVNIDLEKKSNKLSDDQIWNLSEIFNVILLESPLFKDIVDKKNVRPYPEHKKYITQFRRLFKESRNVGMFIENGIKNIK